MVKKQAGSALTIPETAKVVSNADKGNKEKKTVLPKEVKKTLLWRGNQERLKHAGLWTFIEELSTRPWLIEQYLLPFIVTMDDPARLTSVIKNHPIQITSETISRVFRDQQMEHQ